MKIMWILPALLVLTTGCVTGSYYEDSMEIEQIESGWLEASGKGSTKRGALVRAWHEAMVNYVEYNIDSNIFHLHRPDIEEFIKKNWKDYTVGNPYTPLVTSQYDGRNITIKVKVFERLLGDVQIAIKNKPN